MTPISPFYLDSLHSNLANIWKDFIRIRK